MIWLGQAAQGRDNNLNIIRYVAASAVLVSHAWPLTIGAGTAEPLEEFSGHSLGRLAVYVFFAISGFLITASFTRSSTVMRFVSARIMRLMPGLVVSLIFVGLVLGPFTTNLPVVNYLSDPQTWRFIIANTTLVWPQYTLPGVFENNLYPTVEGSIWTLIHEVACYGFVFICGIAGLLRSGWRMGLVLGLYAVSWIGTALLADLIHPRLILLQTLSLPFVLGMSAWVWRDRVPLSGWAALGLLGLWGALRDTPLAYPALIAAVGYGALWLAYVPASGWLRAYNQVGDYSYGTYIYAFPLQGLVVWAVGPTSPLAHVVLALPLTLVFAIASWHLIEAPAMTLLQRGRHPSQSRGKSKTQRDHDSP